MEREAIESGRPRYELLDGLRGVAAMLVIVYHFGEAFATSAVDQMMNHGYLAVDFFFVLSGFVIGYAYDGRMRGGDLGWRGFMVRRVIRLHPMVVLAVALGALAYVAQGSVRWDGSPVGAGALALALVAGLFLIPMPVGVAGDVRGNGEMFPLNGPSWSLFFEYVGSVMYALLLWRLSRRWLAAFVAASGVGLCWVLLGNMSGAYHLGVGWSMGSLGWLGGLLRLSYSFGAGLLLQRVMNRRRVRGAFWLCSLALVVLLSMPYVTADGEVSAGNAVYDAVCTLVLFPALVYVGACGSVTDRVSAGVCGWLGRLSYTVYMVHYPLMYLFYAWVWSGERSAVDVAAVCVAMTVAIVVLAWAASRYYDEPVRRRLTAWLRERDRRR